MSLRNPNGSKVSTTCYIEKRQAHVLALLSLATGRSQADFIREGLDLVAKKYADRLPTQGHLELDE